MAETAATPVIKEETKAALPQMTVRKIIPRLVSATKKKQLSGKSILATEEVYIDRSIEAGGFNSYAADGREDLLIDRALVLSLLRVHDRYKGSQTEQPCAYLKISPAKAVICGTDEAFMIVMLNGRQRTKAAEYINRVARIAYEMWGNFDGGRTDENRVKLKNTLIALANSGHNDPEGPHADFAMFHQEGDGENEGIEMLIGGRVGGIPQPGFLTFTRETVEGPLPFKMRVEYSDTDPNKVEALEMSVIERLSVDTTPLVESRQIKALLEGGSSPTTVASIYNESIATINMRLTVLFAEPEVLAAYDLGPGVPGGLSLKLIYENFFTPTQKRGVIPKAREEQLRLLAKYAGVPLKRGAVTAAVNAEKAWPANFICAGCKKVVFVENGSRLKNGQIKHHAPPTGQSAEGKTPEQLAAFCSHEGGKGYISGEPLTTIQVESDTPGVKNLPPAAAGATVAAASNGVAVGPGGAKTGSPTAGTAPIARKKTSAASGVMAYLPRAAELLTEKAAEAGVLEDSDGAEAKLDKMLRQAKLEGAAASLAYLAGKGDESFGSDSILKEAIIEAIGQAQVDLDTKKDKEIEEKNLSPDQKHTMAVLELFEHHEQMAQDERSEWPSTENAAPEVKAIVGKIQAAYAEALAKGTPEFKTSFEGHVESFAQDWILSQV